jgi:hypothetical protein
MLHGPEPPGLILNPDFGEIAFSQGIYHFRMEGVDPDDVQVSRSLEDFDLVLQGFIGTSMFFIEAIGGDSQDIENYLFLLFIGGLREPGFNKVVLV